MTETTTVPASCSWRHHPTGDGGLRVSLATRDARGRLIDDAYATITMHTEPYTHQSVWVVTGTPADERPSREFATLAEAQQHCIEHLYRRHDLDQLTIR